MKTAHKMAVARAVHRAVLLLRGGRPRRVEARRRGILWELDLDEAIDFVVYVLGSFEPATARALARESRPGATIVDVGANIGAHTLPLAARVGPAGLVLAYEPTGFAFAKLARNVELNPALGSRIRSRRALLTDETRTVTTPVWASWPLVPAVDVHADHRGRVCPIDGADVTTLDAELARLGTQRIDLVKLDVDGGECAVLRGAREVLERDRPVIVMELAPYLHAELGHDLAGCLAPLERLGYTMAPLGGGRAEPCRMDRVAGRLGRGASTNVVARPAAARKA